jgi:addiction module RelE/StbE family toxin
MRIEYSHKFIKEFKKCPVKIRSAFFKRQELFINEQYSSILNNHLLSGKYKNHRSINITGDWRAIFEEIAGGRIIYFVTIGTHSQLYS